MVAQTAIESPFTCYDISCLITLNTTRQKYKSQSRLGAGKRKLANHVRVYYSIMILALVGGNVCELNQKR